MNTQRQKDERDFQLECAIQQRNIAQQDVIIAYGQLQVLRMQIAALQEAYDNASETVKNQAAELETLRAMQPKNADTGPA